MASKFTSSGIQLINSLAKYAKSIQINCHTFKSPDRKKFRSRNELKKYLKETNSTLTYKDLDFLFKGGEKGSKKKKKKKRVILKPTFSGGAFWRREVVKRKSGTTAGEFDVYYYRYIVYNSNLFKFNTFNLYTIFKSPEGEKFQSSAEVKAHLKEANSSISFEELVFIDTSNRGAITRKKKSLIKKDQPKSVQLVNSVALLNDPNLPEGWSRKAVQNQTDKTADDRDTYLY